MPNFKITIEYDGSHYCGWQSQGNKVTPLRGQAKTQSHKVAIQGVIEKALRRILQEKVKLIASGRTDAGVHALAQVANFKTAAKIVPQKLKSALNGLLPVDIAITDVEDVGLDFHSRFCAKSKAYQYVILNRRARSALLKDRVYFCAYPLNLKLMQKEARVLLGRHDFKSFCASGSSAKSSVRTIKNISIKKINYPLSVIRYPLIAIDIEADGFLYNMVRSIVGTLIEIGRGKFAAGSMKKILASGNRKLCGPTAPARGLYLTGVKY